MAASFGGLIEACGVPHVLLPNLPDRAGPDLRENRSAFLENGTAPFLLVRRWVHVPARRFEEARAELEAQRPVALRRGTTRGPRGGVRPTVEVALAANACGLTLEGLRQAVAEDRVLCIWSDGFMGDRYVYMSALGPDPAGVYTDPARYERSHYFVFEPPCRLSDHDLPLGDVGGAHETADAFVDGYWGRYFSEPYPLPPEPPRVSRRTG